MQSAPVDLRNALGALATRLRLDGRTHDNLADVDQIWLRDREDDGLSDHLRGVVLLSPVELGA